MPNFDWSWELLDPETYYDELGHDEWERLEGGFYQRLEFEGTTEYLDQYLPESGHVLDAGGGAGRYTVWLAEHGYDVTLVDLSQEQVSIAREKVAERELTEQVTVSKGDIRDLDFESDTFDATLCLGGPLSHILDEAERETAIEELWRVTKSEAPLFVSVMGRLAVLQLLIQHTGEIADDEDEIELLPELAEHGTYNKELLEQYNREPTCFNLHLFRVDELEALLEEAGLEVKTIAGLEGFASLRRSGLNDLETEKQEPIKQVIQSLREDRAVADISSHILAVSI
jgi:SAM-dependent methyltransferase